MSEFVLPEKRAVLVLDDGDYAGAEISVRLRVPLHVLEEVVAARELPRGDFLRRGGELLIEWGKPAWNIADAEGSIPATVEGWNRLDMETMGAVLAAWLRGLVQPRAPLSPPSSGGTTRKRAKSR